MDATLTGDVVRTGPDGRERFYDSRGYGHPVDSGALELAPVEAAHLLYRDDLDAVDGLTFREFLASAAVSETAFLVYKDLRGRGFYLSPARTGWTADRAAGDPAIDFVVYPRGSGPWDDEVEYRVGVVGERETVDAVDLGSVVLAVVDEESELTYFETGRPAVTGTSGVDLPSGVPGELLADRVFLWDPPERLYDRGFYGQRLDEADEALQLSLVEAAYLARRGVVDLDADGAAVVERGRELEGDRFDRRLSVYATLRECGVVPKTGFKFGADFRTYSDVESVENLGHSDLLVRVLSRDHSFLPRDLALDVRLAHGVRKTMVFALVETSEASGSTIDPSDRDPRTGGDVTWLSVNRLTP